ncbi:MAG: hypothetical protein GY754_22785 [bacterium]|nr:hypothetical protein [bacterium]
MKKRKQMIVDKEFHYKKSFPIICFVSITIILIIMTVAVLITINNREIGANNNSITNNTSSIKKTMGMQQRLYINFSSMPYSNNETIFKETIGSTITDYNNTVDKLNSAIASNAKIIKSNNKIIKMNYWLLGLILLVTIVGIFILYRLLVHHTHQSSGPIFLMSRYINEILNGSYPDMRELRDKDDFKDFYTLFRQMTERYKELEDKNG